MCIRILGNFMGCFSSWLSVRHGCMTVGPEKKVWIAARLSLVFTTTGCLCECSLSEFRGRDAHAFLKLKDDESRCGCHEGTLIICMFLPCMINAKIR